MTKSSFCGYIALVGRPNVGKSTLLNQLIGQKLSITSKKPQTTRHRILGINTDGRYQFIFVDTPGVQQTHKNAMNRMMNKAARFAIFDVDIICFVIEGLQFKEEDEAVLAEIKKTKTPVILVINKVDTIEHKDSLLSHIAKLSQLHEFKAVVPLSAKKKQNIEPLENTLKELLPESPHFYYDDQVTDRSTRFVISEFIREKVFRLSGQELPYATSVVIDSMKTEPTICRIHATIFVERESHKRMIIGKGGAKLKEIGMEARKSIEVMLEKKVFLSLWIKIRQGWSDDDRVLNELGYDE